MAGERRYSLAHLYAEGVITAARHVLLAGFVALSVVACGAGGSQTNCGLDGCTITFPRNGVGEVSVLGVTAKLVGVNAGTATVSVAGQTVTVPVGGRSEVNGFSVGVEQVTDSDVVVRVRPAAG
jgi:hypothetical protein